MYVVFVKFNIKPEFRDKFLTASKEDASQSLAKEPGCIRFEVSVDAGDKNLLYFYEIYADEKAFEAHMQSPHFLKWRETVKDDWFAEPYLLMQSNLFFPEKMTK